MQLYLTQRQLIHLHLMQLYRIQLHFIQLHLMQTASNTDAPHTAVLHTTAPHTYLLYTDLHIIQLYFTHPHLIHLHLLQLHFMHLHHIQLQVIQLHRIQPPHIQLHSIHPHLIHLHLMQLHVIQLHRIQLHRRLVTLNQRFNYMHILWSKSCTEIMYSSPQSHKAVTAHLTLHGITVLSFLSVYSNKINTLLSNVNSTWRHWSKQRATLGARVILADRIPADKRRWSIAGLVSTTLAQQQTSIGSTSYVFCLILRSGLSTVTHQQGDQLVPTKRKLFHLFCVWYLGLYFLCQNLILHHGAAQSALHNRL